MHDEFYSLTEKLKNILRSLYGFGRRFYGSLTMFQESELDLCSTLEHQTWSKNQSQHDFLHGIVSL